MKSNNKAKIFISVRLGSVFLVLGALLFAASYLLTSVILAFLGLGLAFWGALFLIVTPSRYVEGSLLPISVLPSYSTADRIIKQFNCKGKAMHVPSFPGEVYLPEHLQGLKEMVAFIPETDEATVLPKVEDLAEKKLSIMNPKGVLLIPPGLRLLTQLEKVSKIDLTKTALDDLCEILPKALLDDYNFAKEITMELGKNEVTLRISDSIYQGLYTEASAPKSIYVLGCPMVSAVACALAKSSGKPVIIQAIGFAPEALIMEAKYRIGQSE